jgi:hypothetical protein
VTACGGSIIVTTKTILIRKLGSPTFSLASPSIPYQRLDELFPVNGRAASLKPSQAG